MALESPTVVFVGPSLPVHSRPNTGGAVTWRQPASRGDLAGLDLPPGSRVVLIDGYLIQQHPPSPTEVSGLIERGHEVWGCSSLGALRAAELRHHGMRGYGWVYDRVVDRTITYDDELVAPLDPRTGEAAGLFMANIRYGLGQLIAAGRASHRGAQTLIDDLRALHFEQRTIRRCRALAMAAGLDTDAIDELLTSDVKRNDAAALITHITNPVPTP
ncbi:TfuA-like protein [Prauserella flavalba]|uniref:TfuA-like protein n=1 Tax=Prauserella flavalba TaxID=1477506 RepID=UPI0036EE1EE0